jgi:integrase
MARQATGAVVEHRAKDGRIYRALRFSAYGKRRFVSLGPVTAMQAEAELRHVLADVERGTWQPAKVEAPPEPEPLPSFHQLAEQWWLRVERQLAPKTREDYRWRLEKHLLKHFGELQLDVITFDAVERYIAAKLARGLSPRSVNMTVTLLAAILEGAVERELIARNPARGRNRRVRERAPRRSYLDTAAQIEALLDAAGEYDREATRERQHIHRRAMLATMVFAGLRIGELCSLRWRDVDLAGGWLTVGESKTDAGRRRVKIRGALRDELLAVRTRQQVDQSAYVFPTRSGGRQWEDHVRSRTLRPAVQRANDKLAKAGQPPLPESLTPHALRRTFASVLYALGESPPVVMAELGHTSPALALRVYAQTMRRDEDEKAALRALVDGAQLAVIGRRGAPAPIIEGERTAP